ncbi:MAG TPA: hypothetical protein VLS89_11515 [Candidatus Nanopelagicales bacterium]|nr:hypothetical protein [Candidatus Nanopelagicales bacterium]
MSEALAKYRQLEEKLVRIRWIHRGIESPEEDDILEQMDSAWSRLTADEQAQVNAEPVRSLIREGRPTTRSMVDEDVWSYLELPPRSKEVA